MPCQHERYKRAREIELGYSVPSVSRVKYTRVGSKSDPCVYCGRPSDGSDHVPPVSLSHVQVEGHIYPACEECNGSLGCLPLFTLQDRKEHLHERYSRVYSAVLGMPTWTEDELGKLNPDMAQEVRRNMAMRDAMRAVLRNLRA